MTAQILDRVLHAYRIGDPLGQFQVYSPGGSVNTSGRWHSAPRDVIYASEHYSTAMLEKLARSNGILPPNQHYVKLTIPPGLTYEVVDPLQLSGWDAGTPAVSRQAGDEWFDMRRALLLLVPSVVAPVEYNVLINTRHHQFRHVEFSRHERVRWDPRLFPPPPAS